MNPATEPEFHCGPSGRETWPRRPLAGGAFLSARQIRAKNSAATPWSLAHFAYSALTAKAGETDRTATERLMAEGNGAERRLENAHCDWFADEEILDTTIGGLLREQAENHADVDALIEGLPNGTTARR